MSKVSSIISNYVISVYDSKIEGVVSNILFNEKQRAKYFLISQNDEQFCILDTQQVYKLGNGAVIIKNSQKLELAENKELEIKSCYNPINSLLVSINGDLLGHVSDIELDEQYNIKKFFACDGQEYKLNNIVNISDNVIIIYSGNKKPRLYNFKEKAKINISNKEYANQTVSILDSSDTILPNRTITNYNFLINRKVSQNISNFSGEIIIKENQIINTRILDIARMHGKIRELTKYSL